MSSKLRDLEQFEKWCYFSNRKDLVSQIQFLKQRQNMVQIEQSGDEKALLLMRQYKLSQGTLFRNLKLEIQLYLYVIDEALRDAFLEIFSNGHFFLISTHVRKFSHTLRLY